MKKLKIFLLFCLICTVFTAKAQTEITPRTAGINATGVTYFLPTTRVRIAISLTCKKHFPGKFATYANRYLRLEGISQQETISYEIDSIKQYIYGVPDTNKVYTIAMQAKSSAPLVELMPDGRLVAINTSTINAKETLPIEHRGKIISTDLHATQCLTSDILNSGSLAKMAELTANEIIDIRENRNLLTKGQADFMPKDGEQLKLMLQNLDKQEACLMQYFTGHTETQALTYVFDLNPADGVNNNITICNFSKNLGFVDMDDPAGKPITYSTLLLNAPTIEAPIESLEKKSKKVLNDLRYNIPTIATTKINYDGKCYDQRNIAIAQLGEVAHLGGELFNKKFTTKVILNPTTGGIKQIIAAQPE